MIPASARLEAEPAFTEEHEGIFSQCEIGDDLDDYFKCIGEKCTDSLCCEEVFEKNPGQSNDNIRDAAYADCLGKVAVKINDLKLCEYSGGIYCSRELITDFLAKTSENEIPMDICDKFGDSLGIVSCYEALAKKISSIDYCFQMEESKSQAIIESWLLSSFANRKNWCIAEYAKHTHDLSLCDLIEEYDTGLFYSAKKECISYDSEIYDNSTGLKVCNTLTNPRTADECIKVWADKRDDCRYVKDSELRDKCIGLRSDWPLHSESVLPDTITGLIFIVLIWTLYKGGKISVHLIPIAKTSIILLILGRLALLTTNEVLVLVSRPFDSLLSFSLDLRNGLTFDWQYFLIIDALLVAYLFVTYHFISLFLKKHPKTGIVITLLPIIVISILALAAYIIGNALSYV